MAEWIQKHCTNAVEQKGKKIQQKEQQNLLAKVRAVSNERTG